MSGRNNLWVVPAEGGWPVQLTVSDQRQTAPTWSPDGKWIAYQSDYDGDEQWDIFLVSPKTGKVVNLTSTREIAESDPTWSPDGRYLAYVVKPKTSAAYEIDVYDTLMREVKHITTGTPQDQGNSNPIWSKDGKYIVYSQEQAKGTDSNIFHRRSRHRKKHAADAARRRAALLRPMTSISPDRQGRKILITSNAANGYENIGLARNCNEKDFLAHPRQMGNPRRRIFSRRQAHHLQRQRRWQRRYLSARSCHRQVNCAAHSQGRERACRRPFRLHQRWIAPALLSQRPHRSRRSLGLHAGHRQVASGHAFAGRGSSLRRHGRALPRPLSQPRRQVDHLRIPLRSLQHGAQRAECRHRLHSRRSRRRRP